MSQEPAQSQSPIPDETQNNNASLISGPEASTPSEVSTPFPKIPLTTQFFNHLYQSASQGTIPQLVDAATTEALNHSLVSPKLTQPQREKFEKGRPGLRLAPGTSVSGAKYLINKYNTSRAANIISADGNTDFLGHVTNIGSDILGGVTDVPGLAAAAFAPELVGIKRAETLSSMADRAISGVKYGAVEGAAFGSPSVGASFLNDESKGHADSFNGVNAELSIGENMVLGGVLHPIGSLLKDEFDKRVNPEQIQANPTISDDVSQVVNSHSPLGADHSAQASQAAVAQLYNGKDVNVAPILQQGAAAQDAALADNLKQTGATIPQITDSLTDAQLKVNKKLQISNTETSLETLNSRLNQSILQKAELPEDLKQTLKQSPINDLNLGIPQMSEHIDNEIDSLNQKSQSNGLNPDEQQYLGQLTKQNSRLKDWIDQTQNLDSIPDPEEGDEDGELAPIHRIDEFPQKATSITNKLFRETSIHNGLPFIPFSNIRTNIIENLFFSNSKELALGQRNNTGLLLEFDSPKDLLIKVNKSKPGWEKLYKDGKAELIEKNATHKMLGENIRAFTIKKDAKISSKSDKTILNRVQETLLNKGWKKIINFDGSVTFRDLSKSDIFAEIRDAKQQVQSMQDQIEKAKSQPELSDDLFSQKLTEMESKIDELNPLVKGVKDRDVHPTKKLKDLISENIELHNQSSSMKMVHDSLTNPAQPIDKASMDEFLRDTHTSSGNFKDSEPIQEFPDSEDISSAKSLLNDTFPAARQKELMKDLKLDDDLSELQDKIDDEDNKLPIRKRAIKAAINCILGNP